MRSILLLKGVNVGGVKLPMRPFADLLSELGCRNVQTYIQSGQAVYDGPTGAALGKILPQAMLQRFGISPAFFFYRVSQFEAIIDQCPFADAGNQSGSTVHLFFLAQPSRIDLTVLKPLQAQTERFKLTKQTFYLLAPDGIGRSKLAGKLPQLLKVDCTARNWNTVLKLRELARRND